MEQQQEEVNRSVEPKLDDLMNDPIMELLWRSDGVRARDVEAMLQQLPERKAA